jgi:hypothetical protein
MTAELAPALTTPLSLIEAAIEKGIDPDKLGKLLDLQERWERSEAAKEFAAALAGFQKACPMVQKKRAVKSKDGNQKYKFAGFEDVIQVAKPHLATFGIYYSFSSPQLDGPDYVMNCHLQVGSHEVIRPFVAQKPNIDALAKAMYCNEAQAVGGWQSYMKRYSFCAATGLVVCDEDTDAGAIAGSIDSKQMIEINTLLDESGIELGSFLKRHQVERLDELPVTAFGLAVFELRIKADKKRKEAAK